MFIFVFLFYVDTITRLLDITITYIHIVVIFSVLVCLSELLQYGTL